jgi:hypothetical protein
MLKRFTAFKYLFLLAIFAGCGQADDYGSNLKRMLNPSVQSKKTYSRSVGSLILKGDHVCVVSKVAHGWVLTANHCYKDILWGKYSVRLDGKNFNVSHQPKRVKALDVVLLPITQKDDPHWTDWSSPVVDDGIPLIEFESIDQESPVNIITVRESFQHWTATKDDHSYQVAGQFIYHGINTQAGDSGAPLLQDGKIVGLHLGYDESRPKNFAVSFGNIALSGFVNSRNLYDFIIAKSTTPKLLFVEHDCSDRDREKRDRDLPKLPDDGSPIKTNENLAMMSVVNVLGEATCAEMETVTEFQYEISSSGIRTGVGIPESRPTGRVVDCDPKDVNKLSFDADKGTARNAQESGGNVGEKIGNANNNGEMREHEGRGSSTSDSHQSDVASETNLAPSTEIAEVATTEPSLESQSVDQTHAEGTSSEQTAAENSSVEPVPEPSGTNPENNPKIEPQELKTNHSGVEQFNQRVEQLSSKALAISKLNASGNIVSKAIQGRAGKAKDHFNRGEYKQAATEVEAGELLTEAVDATQPGQIWKSLLSAASSISWKEAGFALADLSASMFTPWGFVKDVYEAIEGKEFYSGIELTVLERTLAIVGATTGGGYSRIKAVRGRVSGIIEKISKSGDQAADAARRIADSAKNGAWSKVVESGLKPGKLVEEGMSPLRTKLRQDKGIPDSWEFGPAKDADGISFHKPGTFKADEVRIMPGKPTNPYPNSQVPYVTWKRNGQWLDKDGGILPDNMRPEAHIPLDDFKYKD